MMRKPGFGIARPPWMRVIVAVAAASLGVVLLAAAHKPAQPAMETATPFPYATPSEAFPYIFTARPDGRYGQVGDLCQRVIVYDIATTGAPGNNDVYQFSVPGFAPQHNVDDAILIDERTGKNGPRIANHRGDGGAVTMMVEMQTPYTPAVASIQITVRGQTFEHMFQVPAPRNGSDCFGLPPPWG